MRKLFSRPEETEILAPAEHLKSPPPPSPLQASVFGVFSFKILVLWYVIILAVLVAAQVVFKFSRPVFYNLSMVVTFALPILWFFYYKRRSKIRLRFIFGHLRLKKIPWLKLLGVVIVMEGTMIALNGLTLIGLAHFFPHYIQDVLNSPLTPDVCSKVGSWCFRGIMFYTIAAAPLLEELLFRGFLLHRLWFKWNPTKAILVTAGVFGLLHGETFLAIGLLSLVLSLIYVKEKTLFIPILIHFLHNSLVSALQFLPGGNEPTSVQEFTTLLPGLLVTLVLFGTPLFFYLKRTWPKTGSQPPYIANELSHSN